MASRARRLYEPAMPRTLIIMHVGAIAKLTLFALVVLALPVTALAVLGHVPGPALALGFWWPALQGILPTVVFLLLPAAVGVAVALHYASMAAEGTLAASYALRLSPVALAAPALIVGLGGAALGIVVSAVIAPASAVKIHDTIFTIEHRADPRLLEPRRLYELNGGRQLFRFDGWIDRDTVMRPNLVMNEPDGSRRVLFAERATFVREEGRLSAVFEQGFAHHYQPGASEPNSIAFTRLQQSIGVDGDGTLARRAWRGVFELSTRELFELAERVGLFAPQTKDWVSESFKRFILPLLAIAHALFAVGVVMRFGRISARKDFRPGFWILPVALAHAVFVVFGETVIFVVPWAVWVAVALMIAEAAVGLGWILRVQRGGGPHARATAAVEGPRVVRA